MSECGNITVDYMQLHSCLKELRSQLEKFDKEFIQLNIDIEALDKTWDGPSHQALKNEYYKDLAELDSLRGFLREYIHLLEQCRYKYVLGETRVEMIVKGMRL